MRSRAIETAAVAAVASIIIAAIALPVLRAPSQRIFGMPIAGHHHDPFTFMQQIDGPIVAGPYLQPATDVPGTMIARAAGPVAAYNWLVLLSFPLAAAAAYLLARHLAIAPPWAAVAAIAFAFSPFHLSHAAYHPHIAQTFWIPLYLLALWRTIDRPAPATMAVLALSVAGVTLSNFYGGLIAAVITPVALSAYWLFAARRAPDAARRVAVTTVCLACLGLAGVAYVTQFAGDVSVNTARYAAAPDDLVRYGARWWSYLMPPAAHPIAGAVVQRAWHGAGVDVGLLEQQVSLGWGFVALAFVAAAAAVHRPGAAAAKVSILVSLAAAAFICSLAGGFGALVHPLVPMFRSYARFGVVVQLMMALLAATGAERLWRSGRLPARAACIALLMLAAAEYVVWPPSMSRDALPTDAHRWVAARTGRSRVLDCVERGPDASSIQWLTRNQVTSYGEPFLDCTEPDLAAKLAAAGYTHLLVRRASPEGRWLAGRRTPEGLQAAAHFDDSAVYAVAALVPAVRIVSVGGMHP